MLLLGGTCSPAKAVSGLEQSGLILVPVRRVSAGCQPSVILQAAGACSAPLVLWLHSGFGNSRSRMLHRGLFVNSGDGEFDTLSSEILALKRRE